MHNYKVRYRFETVRKDYTLLHDRYSCVMFANEGETPVQINGNAIANPGESLKFNEDPNVRIDTDFNVHFVEDPNDPTLTKHCVITCSYYEPIH